MKLKPSILSLDLPRTEKMITRFIRAYQQMTDAEGIVLGLSGGIDSSTVAGLASLAIGGSNVLALMLPEDETYNEDDMNHARIVSKKFGTRSEEIDISPALRAIYGSMPTFGKGDKISKGNIKARARMVYWYYYANSRNLLVCGCSDKSETMLGYFTKWGDVAADISPLMDLYKTQVQMLAEHIGIPEEIVTKSPSPTLWPGQLAEDELGIEYQSLDLILYGIEHFMKPEEIAKQIGVEEEFVKKIWKRWVTAEHKRRMPITAKLQYRTVGNDFRLPFDRSIANTRGS